MEDADPRQIGSYEVLAKLAEGGVGTVYLARRRGPAEFVRLVAIKRLHPQFASDADFVTMFTDEARLSARIHHANVVSIVELGADDEGYYVVMEYVEGSNLGHFQWHATRDDRKMPRAVALRILLDALSGLHAAHEIEGDDGAMVNLVHRDVSPQNIVLGMDGLARLGDFGIARAEALRAFETRGAALKGKLEYMAPEQIECKAVDRTTDLFAMGIVTWELLTGRRLFPAAKSQVTTIQRVCFDPIPSPRSVDTTVSVDLDRVCMRALERSRPKRYPTAAVFAEELERAARADAGIATQREVAACMIAVLGPAARGSRAEPTAREVGRSAPPVAAVPDLGGDHQARIPTYQLPPSEPVINVAAEPHAHPTAPPDAHPPVTGQPIATEPLGVVPPRGAGIDRPVTLALPDRPAPPPPPPSSPHGPSSSRHPPASSSVAPPAPEVPASRGTIIAVAAIGAAVALGLVGLGVHRLSASRAATPVGLTAGNPMPVPAETKAVVDPSSSPPAMTAEPAAADASVPDEINDAAAKATGKPPGAGGKPSAGARAGAVPRRTDAGATAEAPAVAPPDPGEP